MSIQLPSTRLGFHYFPDYVHYRQADLNTWLPELKQLGAGWLTLLASPERAIPEFFLKNILEAGIQPIIHFPLSLTEPVDQKSLGLLFSNYARWGVRFVALFDRPNSRQAWPAAAWSRANLVERFLDIYIPLAEMALRAGLYPIFPPLEPGGDYWDTAFLQAALQSIQRRGRQALLDRLVLGAYAWSSNLPLNWGAGGPERWPAARPYKQSPTVQDQRGFRIFDWYQAIAQGCLGKPAPIVLLRAGSRIGDQTHSEAPCVDVEAHTRTNLALAQLADGINPATQTTGLVDALPRQVLACNFWLLSAAPLSSQRGDAWYQPDGSQMPVVEQLKHWQANGKVAGAAKALESEKLYTFEHYLLLPSFEWGVSDWHLDAIRPYVKKYRPTIGFSVEDAKKAHKVTLVGEYGLFPEKTLEELLENGCIVIQIRGTGTELANQLAVL